ncbi:MAG TPA: hypothetical protein VFZ65_15805 [Planctomycetota bacterium]|nr:hypothetical protein [Planctomycetota bacterium]
MKTDTLHRPSVRAAAQRAHLPLASVLCAASLAAQVPLDIKPAPVPDPVKGWHDMSPPTPEELAARRAGPRPPSLGVPGARPIHATPPALPDAVLFDRCGDGRLWSRAPSYKASFGPEGFVYVPFFGADAPRNFPVHFVLRAVRVAGQPLALHDAEPEQHGQRVTFHRGAVQEVYDLRTDAIEQTFVVDSPLAGDVEVEIRVVTELVEDAATPGIQFGNELGRVDYGAAHVVDGTRLRPVATTFAGDTITIRVPAAERGPGALVIDPIVQTGAYTQVATGDAGQPDIAYDATFNRYLVVWQHPFSAADIDVWSEFWDGDGLVVPGTLASIDFTSLSCSNPRVANLNAYDRFLVVMQRFETGSWNIMARMRPANGVPHPTTFQVNDPAVPHPCTNPDIGGDSGTGDHWLVVWQREFTVADFDIHARRVRADLLVEPGTLFVENTAAAMHSMPTVSQSNGNGFTSTPRWLVAYQFRYSATDEDIYGSVIAPDGTITVPNTPIDTSFSSDLVPSVSSPRTTGGSPLFLVTYERASPAEARARLLSASLVDQIPAVNLTASFGFGPFWVRAESDGNRFAVLSGAATISVATLAYTGSSLVMHESPQVLPAIPFYPRLCSKRSGGGIVTDYGLAYVDLNWFPDRIIVAMYRGHAPSANFTQRAMACNGLQLGVAGRAMLADTMTFTLSNAGTDIPGFVFGSSLPATGAFCPSCLLGVNPTGAILIVGTTLAVPVPPDASLVGTTGSVQGFALGSGPCLLSLHFSDTIDFAIG